MKTILHHPTGNGNVRAAVVGLHNAGLLNCFYTTVATFPGNLLDRFSSFKMLKELRRRSYAQELKPVTKQWPFLEVARLLSTKAGFGMFTQHEKGLFSIDAVWQNLDNHMATSLRRFAAEGTEAIYGYEDGAAFSFKEAKKYGLECLYDLPIGYWRAARRLLEPELQRWPDWASTLTGFQDSQAKLDRKDKEIKLADRIFVASRFTAETLLDYPDTLPPVEVIPYGFPPVYGGREYAACSGGKPLKLLFVGSLSQRKGIANLFAAVNTFKRKVELTVVGQKVGTSCAPLDIELSKHCWIPSLPHDQILKLMRVHDVLVFPSLFEGFGLVITEAMSQGTPVITTERTAGPDLIVNGKNGWIVKAGSTDALREAIAQLLLHPASIAANGKEAMNSARNRPWQVYGQELAEAVERHSVYDGGANLRNRKSSPMATL